MAPFFYMVRCKENLVFFRAETKFFLKLCLSNSTAGGNAAGQKRITRGCRQSVPVRRALRLASA